MKGDVRVRDRRVAHVESARVLAHPLLPLARLEVGLEGKIPGGVDGVARAGHHDRDPRRDDDLLQADQGVHLGGRVQAGDALLHLAVDLGQRLGVRLERAHDLLCVDDVPPEQEDEGRGERHRPFDARHRPPVA